MNGNLSEMGQYIAEKRAEKGLTQQQLADRLHVTNKAVSKWETGRGLPDIQMLEPLSEALGVTPAELLRCGRPEPEAETVREALQYSEKRTREKIFRRIGWALVALGLLVGGGMLPFLITDLQRLSMYDSTLSVIGGADGPTSILVAGESVWPGWLGYLLPVALALAGILFLLLGRKGKR